MDIDDNGELIHFGKWSDNDRAAKYGPFEDYFKKYIDNNYDNFKDYFLWSPHGIVTVEKEMIRNRSIDSYKSIIETLSYGEDVQEGHYIERAWYYIFQKYYKFSYGQSCKNRLSFLKQTLNHNLTEIKKYPKAILTLLNYNSQDDLNNYIYNNFKDESKLLYIVDNESTIFHMSKSKNITGLECPDDIDIVSWCDCDNFMHRYTIYNNNAIFNTIKNTAVFPEFGKDNNWDAGNRIAVYKKSLSNNDIRYNESFLGWGYDDIDFKNKCIIKFNCKYQHNKILTEKKSLEHNDNLRLNSYDCYNKEKIEAFIMKNNINEDFSRKVIKMYGYDSRKTTELLNKYISNSDLKLYFKELSDDNLVTTDKDESFLIDDIVSFMVNLNSFILVKSLNKTLKFNFEITLDKEHSYY